ncbi:MAG: class II aldolase/adducin family protein [Armatimonadetes bacterium]|nr:class II aldolase/adducin family protein [Armatimonadota bacterium]
MNERYRPILEQLTALSLRLGDPARDLVILGEGNTSAAVDEDVFLIKASGHSLSSITPEGFVAIRRRPVLDLLEKPSLTDAEVKAGLRAAAVDQSAPPPSVETTFHAWLLGLEGARFVAHTHPTAINSLLCARDGEKIVMGSLFPDQIVICGVAPVVVPYTDPGVPLARAIGDGVRAYCDRYGEVPRAVLARNHGLIAIGETAAKVESITAMWVKTARVLLGTLAAGGPQFLTPENVARIHTRPDEEARRKLLFQG